MQKKLNVALKISNKDLHLKVSIFIWNTHYMQITGQIDDFRKCWLFQSFLNVWFSDNDLSTSNKNAWIYFYFTLTIIFHIFMISIFESFFSKRKTWMVSFLFHFLFLNQSFNVSKLIDCILYLADSVFPNSHRSKLSVSCL